MKFRTLSAALALLAGVVAPAQAANIDVGVSIGISQPGVHGRIDIGRYPQPQLVYTRPVIVTPPRIVVVQPQPVYMWVPPGQRKNWRKHCQAYGACGTAVVFVRDGGYPQQVYVQGQRRAKGYRHDHDDDD
jgi:hypothetical protein